MSNAWKPHKFIPIAVMNIMSLFCRESKRTIFEYSKHAWRYSLALSNLASTYSQCFCNIFIFVSVCEKECFINNYDLRVSSERFTADVLWRAANWNNIFQRRIYLFLIVNMLLMKMREIDFPCLMGNCLSILYWVHRRL